MKFIITNTLGHKKRPRVFLDGEKANNYITKACSHVSFTTATVSTITNSEVRITIWDTMY